MSVKNHKIAFGNNLTDSVQYYWLNRQMQFLCQIKCSFVKTSDFVRIRTCSFGENHNRKISSNAFFQMFSTPFSTLFYRIKTCCSHKSSKRSEERRVGKECRSRWSP